MTEVDERVLESIFNAANQAVGMADEDRFTKLTELTLKLVAREVGRHLTPQRSVHLFVPVEVEVAGKREGGALVLLDGAAIIAWHTGTFRIKNAETVVPLASVTSVTTADQRRGPVEGTWTALTIHADRTWTVCIPPGASTLLVQTVVGVLEGWASFDEDRPDGQGGDQ